MNKSKLLILSLFSILIGLYFGYSFFKYNQFQGLREVFTSVINSIDDTIICMKDNEDNNFLSECKLSVVNDKKKIKHKNGLDIDLDKIENEQKKILINELLQEREIFTKSLKSIEGINIINAGFSSKDPEEILKNSYKHLKGV